MLTKHPPYLAATAESWDSTLNRFTDISGNGRHGTLVGGTAAQGTVAGHGAAINVPFVGGTTATQTRWPAGSVPSTFTICSVTRYMSTSGSPQKRILQSASGNWLHGHWGDAGGSGHPGATFYEGSGNHKDDPVTAYTKLGMTSRTDWVVTCGRNTRVSGKVGTMANGVTTSVAEGGAGNKQLAINIADRNPEKSDWQLSRLYVWNSHLPDDAFVAMSDYLMDFLAGSGGAMTCSTRPAGKPTNPPPSFPTTPSLSLLCRKHGATCSTLLM